MICKKDNLKIFSMLDNVEDNSYPFKFVSATLTGNYINTMKTTF